MGYIVTSASGILSTDARARPKCLPSAHLTRWLYLSIHDGPSFLLLQRSISLVTITHSFPATNAFIHPASIRRAYSRLVIRLISQDSHEVILPSSSRILRSSDPLYRAGIPISLGSCPRRWNIEDTNRLFSCYPASSCTAWSILDASLGGARGVAFCSGGQQRPGNDRWTRSAEAQDDGFECRTVGPVLVEPWCDVAVGLKHAGNVLWLGNFWLALDRLGHEKSD